MLLAVPPAIAFAIACLAPFAVSGDGLLQVRTVVGSVIAASDPESTPCAGRSRCDVRCDVGPVVARLLQGGAPRADARVELHPIDGGAPIVLRADEEGRVHLPSSVDDEGPWHVVAAAPGATTRDLVAPRATRGVPLEIELGAVAFGSLCVVRSDGAHRPARRGVHCTEEHLHLTTRGERVRALEQRGAGEREDVSELERRQLELAGLPPRSALDGDVATFLVWSPSHEAPSARVHGVVRDFDSAAVEVEFALGPLGDDAVFETVRLDTLPTPTGRVRLRLDGEPFEGAAATLPDVVVLLEGGHVELVLSTRRDGDVLRAAFDVPQGRYSARVAVEAFAWRSEPVDLDVGHGVAPLALALPPLGALRVHGISGGHVERGDLWLVAVPHAGDRAAACRDAAHFRPRRALGEPPQFAVPAGCWLVADDAAARWFRSADVVRAGEAASVRLPGVDEAFERREELASRAPNDAALARLASCVCDVAAGAVVELVPVEDGSR